MGLRRAGPCLWESMEADVSATAGPPEVLVIIIPKAAVTRNRHPLPNTAPNIFPRPKAWFGFRQK